jgi:tRNA pseudouridine13 synthase
MLSAARSLVFNAILAERVARGTWNSLQTGDVANLDARGSVFAVDAVDDVLAARCAMLEIHPTAPLVGGDASLASSAVRELEEATAAQFPEALAVVAHERMNSERRALRLRVRGLEHEYADDGLRLRFELAAGSFATTVLREIIAAGDLE